MSYDSDEDNNDEGSIISENIYNINILVGDKLIIFFSDDNNYIGTVEDFTGNNMVILSVDGVSNKLLELNENQLILLNT